MSSSDQHDEPRDGRDASGGDAGLGRSVPPERAPIPSWDDHDPASEGERLQKVLAAAGVASRRVCENLIAAGRVRVDGEVVTELGRRIQASTAKVEVDGIAIQLDQTKRYLMLNKPVGVVSSMSDEQGRPDLRVFTDRYEERLYNVGRLDAETSGLLILTNDGELAHVLAHPSFGVSKTYIAKVSGAVTSQVIRQLQEGVELEDGVIAADKARLLAQPPGAAKQSLVEITLHSGKNRIVRRMLAAVGHPVRELVRRQFGPLHLGTLPVGKVRELTGDELGQLLTLSRNGADAPPPEPPRVPAKFERAAVPPRLNRPRRPRPTRSGS